MLDSSSQNGARGIVLGSNNGFIDLQHEVTKELECEHRLNFVEFMGQSLNSFGAASSTAVFTHVSLK